VLDLSSKAIGHGAWFCIRKRLDVILRVAGDLDFKVAVLRTLFLHPDTVIAEHDVSVNDLFAAGTN